MVRQSKRRGHQGGKRDNFNLAFFTVLTVLTTFNIDNSFAAERLSIVINETTRPDTAVLLHLHDRKRLELYLGLVFFPGDTTRNTRCVILRFQIIWSYMYIDKSQVQVSKSNIAAHQTHGTDVLGRPLP